MSNKLLIPSINIKKILSLTSVDGKATSFLIIDQGAQDNIHKSCCRQWVLHPQKNDPKKYEVFPYNLQNYMGIPTYELFVEKRRLKAIYSNMPEFRLVINTLHDAVFDLQYRNGGVKQWLL